MADTSFNRLHLAFMEEVLPVGMAIIDRAKEGGASKVIEGFSSSAGNIETLRGEGSVSAQDLRDKLDQIRPGLGNPALDVKVAVNDTASNDLDHIDDVSLTKILKRIDDRLTSIQEQLDNQLDLNS